MSALSAIVANEETELFVQVLAIVANNDTERFAQVFEFIAQRTQVTLDVAEQFFYKNHRDIVNTVLDLTIEVDLATTKKKTTSTSACQKRRLRGLGLMNCHMLRLPAFVVDSPSALRRAARSRSAGATR